MRYVFYSISVIVLTFAFGWIFLGPIALIDALVINPNELVFDENAPYLREVSVKNSTNKRIRILDVATSCPCLTIDCLDKDIKPSDKTLFNIQVDSARAKRSKNGLVVVDFVVTYTIGNSSAKKYVDWSVRFSRNQLIVVSPMQFNFRNPIIKGNENTCVAKVTCDSRIASVLAELESDLGTVALLQSTENVGEYQLTFTPNKTAPVGFFDLSVVLTGYNSNSKIIERLTFPIRGTIEDKLGIIPKLIVIDGSNDRYQETVVIKNSLDSACFELINIDTSEIQSGKIEAKVTDTVDPRLVPIDISFSGLTVSEEAQLVNFELRERDTEQIVKVPLRILISPKNN